MATAVTPTRIEATLLVLEQFRDPSGQEWRRGDRAPLRHRAVREAARDRPELFAMEYATEPVDQDWLAELDRFYEAEYEQAKATRDQAEVRQERALRKELAEQDRPDPKDLERRFKAQEKEREERAKEAREARERRIIEAELVSGDVRSGFHFND